MIRLSPKDVASSPAKQGSAVQAGKTQPKSLKDFFVSKGFKAVDCRLNNGCLWILGERKELAPYVTEAERLFGVAGGYGAGKGCRFGHNRQRRRARSQTLFAGRPRGRSVYRVGHARRAVRAAVPFFEQERLGRCVG